MASLAQDPRRVPGEDLPSAVAALVTATGVALTVATVYASTLSLVPPTPRAVVVPPPRVQTSAPPVRPPPPPVPQANPEPRPEPLVPSNPTPGVLPTPPLDCPPSVVVTFLARRVWMPPDAAPSIRAFARWVNAHPDAVVVLRGHADQTGDEVRNLEVSRDRALVVRQALVREGVASRRIVVRALGEYDPLETASGADRSNRRVEVRVRGASPACVMGEGSVTP